MYLRKKERNSSFFRLTSDTFHKLDPKSRLSEFQAALLRVYEYSIGVSTISVGNDMRRIVETLNHFYGIDELSEESIGKIFRVEDTTKYSSFYTLIQHSSHLTPEGSLDPLTPDIIMRGVNQFIELIEGEGSLLKQTWNKAKATVDESRQVNPQPTE